MSYIGYSAVGNQQLELGRFNATSTTIKAMRIDQVGIEPCMYEVAATWPNWPATATFTRYAPALGVYYMSIFFTEGENDEAGISSITAYISHLFAATDWVEDVVFQAALYDTDANLLGTTVQVTRTPAERPPAWVEFPFTTPLSREAGEPLYIALWAAPPPDLFFHKYDTYFYAHQGGYEDQDYWQPIPPDPSAPDGGSGPAGPLFTGGGML